MRALRRAPAFTVTAILTLAIGMGAATAIFTALRAIVLQPLPYPDADRLYGAWLALPGMHYEGPQLLATYFTDRQFAHSIEGIAVFDYVAVDVADAMGADHLQGAAVSASLFPLLGADLIAGRPFTESEDSPGGPPAVILSHGLWQQRFARDRAIIGKSILVDGRPRVVVGVAAAGFRFPDARTQLWLPIALDPHAVYAGGFAHRSLIKLKPGVSPDAAQRELDQLLPRAAARYPEMFAGLSTAAFLSESKAHTLVRPMRDDVIGGIRGVLWVAMAAGALILLTACANVASLLLTRADARRREFGVRAVLGASRLRIFSQHAVESGVLVAIGTALGVILADAGVGVLRRVGPAEIPRLAEVHIDWGVVSVTVSIACLVTVALSLVPMRSARTMGLSLRGSTAGRDRQRLRRTLLVAQVAFATVLVGGAGLLIRSIDRLRHVEPGFDAQHAVALWLNVPRARYPSDSDVMRFTNRVLDRVASVPGVRDVGISSKVPLDPIGRAYTPVWSDNDQTSVDVLPPSEQLTTVTEGYFSTMGIPLLAGRTFFPIDRQPQAEAIVDAEVAGRVWHDPTGRRALGRRVRFVQPNGPWFTVVGVVGSVHDTSLAAPQTGAIYLPQVHSPDTTMAQVARTLGVVVRGGSIAELRRSIHDLDPTIAVFDVSVLSDVVSRSMARLSFVLLILAVAAGVALSLAAIGLYGVIAYMVTLRTSEIGLRIALGAEPRRVMRLVTYQGAALAGLGIVAGLGLFGVVSRTLRSLVFGVGVVDALTLTVMACVLLVVAIGASWFPACRAARIDPVRALMLEG